MDCRVEKDLRVKKTKKLVFDAMLELMLRRRFEQITVNELCLVAQISRATFYVHFEDKYDLLRLWLTRVMTVVYNKALEDSPGEKDELINSFINENRRIIENLLVGADSETFQIVFGVICSFSRLSSESENKLNPEYVVLSNFYAGGMISYLLWQARNRFPKEVPVVNGYLKDMIREYL